VDGLLVAHVALSRPLPPRPLGATLATEKVVWSRLVAGVGGCGMADRRRWMLVLGLAVVLVGEGCSDGSDDSSGGTSTSTTSTTVAVATEEEIEAFCGEMERLDVATSEAYVGSEEHLADVESLLAVAPDEIRPAVERFRDFVGSGQITDEPDSKDLESWPAEVQDAVAAIRDFQDVSC
jgi:hypothetical protein